MTITTKTVRHHVRAILDFVYEGEVPDPKSAPNGSAAQQKVENDAKGTIAGRLAELKQGISDSFAAKLQIGARAIVMAKAIGAHARVAEVRIFKAGDPAIWWTDDQGASLVRIRALKTVDGVDMASVDLWRFKVFGGPGVPDPQWAAASPDIVPIRELFPVLGTGA